MSSPEKKQNCYTTFDEPSVFFSDKAIVPPDKAIPPVVQPPEPLAEQSDQKS